MRTLIAIFCSFLLFLLITWFFVSKSSIHGLRSFVFGVKQSVHSEYSCVRTLVQLGHNREVDHIVFTDDEKTFATQDATDQIKVWDTQTGRLLSSFPAPSRYGYIIGFDTQGNLVHLTTESQTIINPLTGESIQTTEPRYAIAENHRYISRDGRFAVTWSYNSAAKSFDTNPQKLLIELWRIPEGELITIIQTLGTEKEKIVLSPTGKFLGCLTEKTNEVLLKIWRSKDGRLIKTGSLVKPPEIEVPGFSLSPDGELIAFIKERNSPELSVRYQIYRTADLSLVKTLTDHETDMIPECFFDSAGKFFVTRLEHRKFSTIWRLNDWTKYVKSESACNVAISPTSRYVVVTPGHVGGWHDLYFGYQSELHDLHTGRVTKLHEESSWIMDVAFSADGKRVGIIDRSKDAKISIKVFDLFLGTLLCEFPGSVEDWFREVMLSGDGEYVAARAREGPVFVWKVPEGVLVSTLSGYSNRVSLGIALNSDGRLVARGTSRRVDIFHSNTGELVEQIQVVPKNLRHGVVGLAFSTDNRYLAVATSNWWEENLESIFGRKIKSENMVVIWDREKREFVSSVLNVRDDRREIILPLGFSSNSKLFHSGYKIWEFPGEKIRTIYKNTNDFIQKGLGRFWIQSSGTCFSAEGPNFITLSKNAAAIDIKDLHTGELKGTLYNMREGAVLVTTEGFFSGSGNLERYVHFATDKTVYGFDQFSDVFHRPDLVKMKMEGKDISRSPSGSKTQEVHPNPN